MSREERGEEGGEVDFLLFFSGTAEKGCGEGFSWAGKVIFSHRFPGIFFSCCKSLTRVLQNILAAKVRIFCSPYWFNERVQKVQLGVPVFFAARRSTREQCQPSQ